MSLHEHSKFSASTANTGTTSRITYKGASEELVLEHKPTSYWQRHKKPTVNYLHDSPFASDRQLEDQRLLIEQNRNPQLLNPTKVDKPRSIQITQRTGVSRPVAIKANVLNKIVREASGIHTYTIVAPPRAADTSVQHMEEEKLDPETNPHFRAYAQEAKQKPVLMSFGHRPKSASRTFHPSTMKFRLRQGEIIPTDVKRTSIGLPVDVLDKVLHAPKIISPFEAAKLEQSKASPTTKDGTYNLAGSSAHSTGEFHGNMTSSSNKPPYDDLFFTKEQQQDMFGDSVGDMSSFNGSWISSKRSKKKAHKLKPLSKDDRPAWDEGFHRINKSNSEFFKLKTSGLVKKDVPLSELLTRFSKLTIAENQMHPFCLDRQELDKKELGGEVTQVPKSIPVKGQPLYYDPWDYHVMEVRKLKEVKEKEEAERIAAKTYQLSLHDIPLVDYYATTKLREFRQSTASSQASQSQSAGAPDDGQAGLSRSMTGVSSMSAGGEFDGMMTAESNTRAGTAASFNESVELDSSYPYWYLLEEEMKKSYKAAKKGDRAALYEINIGRHLRSSGSNKGFNDTASMVSSVGMDSIYDMDEVQRLDDEVDGTRAQTTHADRMMMLARSDEADEEDEEQEES